MLFSVLSLLVVGLRVGAVPNLVERAPAFCTAANVVSVLDLLSANTGATFCDQLLDISEPTETSTAISTTTDTSIPMTTTTVTTYSYTTTIAVGGDPQITVMKRFIEARQERGVAIPSYLSDFSSSVLSEACSCFTPIVTKSSTTTVTPVYRTEFASVTTTIGTTITTASTTVLVGLADDNLVYGPSTCMPGPLPSGYESSSVYFETYAPAAVESCANICNPDPHCIVFMVYQTASTYTCVEYSRYNYAGGTPTPTPSLCTYTDLQVWTFGA